MKTEIQNRLTELEHEHGINILYACESGSRAWGFASPDSDYDVRFIYRHAPEWYLSVHDRDHTIDLPLEGELDLRGWDLRKALRLFAKSNGSLVEWLHSPVVYHENKEIVSGWRTLVADIVSPKALACHYIGQCKRIWHGLLQSDQVRVKHYLYAVRSLLAAKWILQRRTVAPVEFSKLIAGSELPTSIESAIEQLVAQKATADEHLVIEQNPQLHSFIDLQLDALSQIARQMRSVVADYELVDAFLREAINDPTRTQSRTQPILT